MNKTGNILTVYPKHAIPGGEVSIECEGLDLREPSEFSCLFNERPGRIVGASKDKVLAIVPEDLDETDVDIRFVIGDEKSDPFRIKVAERIADNMHQVANPAVDPGDGSIILTRSGSRGQSLPVTLFRLDPDGFLSELNVSVMNPTGLAFNPEGRLFTTNRAEGEVYQFNSDDEAVPIESDLGVATGIVFDRDGNMYVGDRSGTIYKISELGAREAWAILEPSVSAYHMAFGPDGRMYVTAPGLCSHDVVYRLDEEGLDSVFYKGLGRPQGLAFDTDGNLYVAACHRGRHGIVRIEEGGEEAGMFVAGMGVVGLCFTRDGDMIIATNGSIYRLPVGISGTLLAD